MTMPTATAASAAQLQAVQDALSRQDVERAVDLADQALARGEIHPLFLNLAAHRLQQQGRIGAALDLLHKALDIDPNDPYVLNSIGNCFTQIGVADQALLAFQSALSVMPDFAQAHHGVGLALAVLGDRKTAYRAHRQAALLAPDFADPVGALAAMFVEDDDAAQAREHAQRALALDARQNAAVLALATLDVREGANEAALRRLDDRLAAGGLPALHAASMLRLRADALDALDRPTEAMAAYAAANGKLREAYSPDSDLAPELGVERAERLLRFFDRAARSDWTAAPSARRTGAGERGHVFLVGFPRSGTTLLEQVLASHPAVVALEEKPTLQPAISEFFADDAGLDRLATLSAEAADSHRETYWARVREFGVDPTDKVFVDKMPLNTLNLPLVAKLFPDATVILAIRDPRDVVASCFRRRFKANALVIEFTDLERTARLYDGTMRLAQVYRKLLALPVYEHRHERLVEAFDEQARALCAFLDLPWDKAVHDFVETANRRDIRTPSAAQVRRGIYQESIGQWRRYGESLAVVRPILAPWVAEFGYPEA
ncbi:MAG: sulfotransferase family protein [Phenylobacterium sp.]|nr:MAG: sulfotransferase family protein [Phenylobacterium sp.]